MRADQQHFGRQGHADQFVAISDVSKPQSGLYDFLLGKWRGLGFGKTGYGRLLEPYKPETLLDAGMPKPL